MGKVQIGWFVLTEEKEFKKADYECASWYQVIKVPAGKYPVYGRFAYSEREDKETNEIKYNSIVCRLDGVIVESDFSAHFAGERVGNKVNTDVGENGSVHLYPYSFQLAKWILEGEGCYELLPEFEAREIKFTYDSEERVTYGIFKK
jgi:hypothetical protein